MRHASEPGHCRRRRPAARLASSTGAASACGLAVPPPECVEFASRFRPCTCSSAATAPLRTRFRWRDRAVSSAVEHCLHTARVAGSNPAPPTTQDTEIARNDDEPARRRFFHASTVPAGPVAGTCGCRAAGTLASTSSRPPRPCTKRAPLHPTACAPSPYLDLERVAGATRRKWRRRWMRGRRGGGGVEEVAGVAGVRPWRTNLSAIGRSGTTSPPP
jgi:hypothetical protein